MFSKKILISLSIIGAAVAVGIGATTALFNDPETSSGNIFTAGILDLKVDSKCSYNGVEQTDCTWIEPKNLESEDLFFNYKDLKPGDYGENTISLHVEDNDAWVCGEVSNLTSLENSCSEPEIGAEPNCESDDVGELQNALVWNVWKDDGAGGGVAGDNIQNGTEQTLASGNPTEGVLALYDSTTGSPLAGNVTSYIGVSWSFPKTSGNEFQTDKLTGDISFYAVQARNNTGFVCVEQTPPPTPVEEICGDGIDNDEDGQIDEDCDLFFSEYIEGLSFNKALEIYNPTGSSIDLSGYKIESYVNGSSVPTYNLTLSSVNLASHDVYVICNSAISPDQVSKCDLTISGTTNVVSFNGNDSIALRKTDGTFIDVIGKIGQDPDPQWGTGLTSTQDNTLVRKCSVVKGDTNGGDVFDPATEWDGYAVDYFSNLGLHTHPCQP